MSDPLRMLQSHRKKLEDQKARLEQELEDIAQAISTVKKVSDYNRLTTLGQQKNAAPMPEWLKDNPTFKDAAKLRSAMRSVLSRLVTATAAEIYKELDKTGSHALLMHNGKVRTQKNVRHRLRADTKAGYFVKIDQGSYALPGMELKPKEDKSIEVDIIKPEVE